MQYGGKMDLFIEKRKLSDFSFLISLQMPQTARKSVKGRDDWDPFVHLFQFPDFGPLLLNRERSSSFLSLGGAIL